MDDKKSENMNQKGFEEDSSLVEFICRSPLYGEEDIDFERNDQKRFEVNQ